MTVSRSGHIASDTRTTNWKEFGIIHGLHKRLSLHFSGQTMEHYETPVRSADDSTLVSNHTYYDQNPL